MLDLRPNNQNGNGKAVTPPKTPFDQPVVLRRSPFLSRAIIWTIAGVTTFGFIWACVAKVDESVMATGKLAPQGSIKEVKAPLNGVVKEIHIEDGQRVKQGDLLLVLDSRTAQAQTTALQKVKAALSQENQFYRSVLRGVAAIPTTVNVSPEIADLTKSRSTLVAENRLYRLQLDGAADPNLNPDEQLRLKSALSEAASREAAAQLEIEQLQQQLARTEVELAGAKDIVVVNEQILQDIEAVAREGALSRVQYLEQRQKVRSGQSEVEQLTKERSRLQLAINQAREKLENTQALSQQDVLTKMAANDQKIAEIDTQLNKAIVENEKQIAEIENQLSQAQVTLQYQQLRAPVEGTVFDLQVTAPGFVTNSAEPLLKIVPSNTLVAEVSITNRDIGFVEEGMPVDVRIDSFPFSEFGDIKGELISVGSDALPPDEIRPYYTFPAKVRMNQEFLQVRGREIPLQSGMSISANIKVRDRTVLSIFTDRFVHHLESLKFVR
ncbi:secretion protein HlyD family protein (plasmid) [Gloeocapsa sp. PCC 7428]|uniref:HlyD family efflux transporter periplasmic adaptor subunit n=1 Tax=Gloeocapsa sp. PCC 7428 TaxID=1173026 RepID=UPI0002A5BFC4|nr:HlyD family efflux transporter periplasmic adaptor subunit [Gloeocapsa sp. PCC 7428]AFZ33400.1 secretion protein HlyD family protein [Gloeocapsa sp. PCC 7428]